MIFENTTGTNAKARDYVYALNELQMVVENGVESYYYSDILGSTRFITDASANVVQETICDPFGKELLNAYKTEGTQYAFKFAGHDQVDSDTGLLYMGARWYDPSSARFLSPDPMQQNNNYYAYCQNNPTTNIDPSGLYNDYYGYGYSYGGYGYDDYNDFYHGYDSYTPQLPSGMPEYPLANNPYTVKDFSFNWGDNELNAVQDQCRPNDGINYVDAGTAPELTVTADRMNNEVPQGKVNDYIPLMPLDEYNNKPDFISKAEDYYTGANNGVKDTINSGIDIINAALSNGKYILDNGVEDYGKELANQFANMGKNAWNAGKDAWNYLTQSSAQKKLQDASDAYGNFCDNALSPKGVENATQIILTSLLTDGIGKAGAGSDATNAGKNVENSLANATSKTSTGGVYDLTTSSGKYVGQSKNFMQRIMQHFSKNGKLNGQTLIDDVYNAMPGSTKLEREVYEQFLINKYGGPSNMINKVNPMGGRMDTFYNMIDDVITKYNLPQ